MRNPHNDTLGSDTCDTASSRASGSKRRCILTGRNAPRDQLLRLALSRDGDVLPDALALAPGRGAGSGVSGADLQQAIASGKLRGALARGFKTGQLTIPDNLPDLLDAALRKAFAQRLGLELRSGRLILGSDRIAQEARMGRVAGLYHASDASEDGCRKLDQAWRVGMDAEGSGTIGARLPLDRQALSVALGRENVVHLGLADAKSVERVGVPLGRLQTYLGVAGAFETQAFEPPAFELQAAEKRTDRDADVAARTDANTMILKD